MKSMNVKKIKIEDLKLKLDCDVVNVIGIEPKSLLTTLKIRKINLNDGYFSYDNRIDIAKIVVVERHKNTGNIGIGLVENFKIKEGAFATTIAHDSHNIIVVGKDDLSIKTCIDELIKIDGGLVVANKNTVIQSIQLEIGGLMSDTPILNMTDKFNKILKTLHEDLGIRNDMDPFMMLSFLALPVIPDLKMTDKGLFDVKNFKHLKVDQLEEKQ
jgi:adenine deaminase